MLLKVLFLTCLAFSAISASEINPEWMSPSFNSLGDWIQRQVFDGIKTFEESMNSIRKNMDDQFKEIDQIREQNLTSDDLGTTLFLVNNKNVSVQYNLGGCNCVNYTCACRAHLEVPQINLNETVGLNLTYLKDDFGLELTFDINGKVLYNNTVSATNPPEMCFDVPLLKEAASLCIKFYKLEIFKSQLSGCTDVIAKLANVEVARLKIGCFRLAQSSRYYEQSVVSMSDGSSAGKTLINEFNQQNGKDFTIKSVSVMNNDLQIPSVSLNILPGKSLLNSWDSLLLERKRRN